MNEQRTGAPSMSTIGRVADHAVDTPQPRARHDSETLNRAVERFWSTRWADLRRRGATAVLSAVMASGATASGFVLADDPASEPERPRLAACPQPVECPHEDEIRREARLILDYLAAIIRELRRHGVDVEEPRPEPLPPIRTQNGTP
jgi:hypothetical protein